MDNKLQKAQQLGFEINSTTNTPTDTQSGQKKSQTSFDLDKSALLEY